LQIHFIWLPDYKSGRAGEQWVVGDPRRSSFGIKIIIELAETPTTAVISS